MDKKITLKFNKVIDNFLDELHKILPSEKDIVIFKSQIGVANMIDESKMLKSFIKYVLPYKQHILDKNEDFFLGDNISIKDDYLSKAIHLTDLWKSKLSDDNKQVVWKYFQVMVVLSSKCA